MTDFDNLQFSRYAKTGQLVCLVISMSTFFPLSDLEPRGSSAFHFVTAMLVSAFLNSLFLLISYCFRAHTIQNKMFDLMTNGFYTVMLLGAAIALFVLSSINSVAIMSGLFSILTAFLYGFDAYLAFLTCGIALRIQQTDGTNSNLTGGGNGNNARTTPTRHRDINICTVRTDHRGDSDSTIPGGSDVLRSEAQGSNYDSPPPYKPTPPLYNPYPIYPGGEEAVPHQTRKGDCY